MSGIFDQIINYSPPLTVSGTVNYKGTWDASANSPTLSASPAASTKGDYYVVSVAGTQFTISFAVGDWIISNGAAWEKVDLTDSVSSVFGRTGAVVGVSTDYSSVGLTNTAIGAANPSTGAFTTVTASSTIAATGAVTGSNLSGTNTGDQTTISGNAGTATALQTSRTIGGSSFNGTTNVTSFPSPGAIGGTTPADGTFTNAYADTLSAGFTSVAATATVTTLVVGSVRDWTVTGSGGQTFQLPDATTLRNGAVFQFNNNQSSGTVVVRNNSATTVATLQSGSYLEIILLSNATTAGSWDVHNQAPSNVSWSTNTFDYPGSITSATWNGNIVQSNRGGTGNGFTKFSGPTTAERTFTLPDASSTLLYSGGPLGTPSSATLTSATGLPISTGVSGLGTGIATALAVNVGSAGAPVVNGGALGTPSSGTVTNLTGTASININGTVGATTASTVAATTLAVSSTSSFSTSAPTVPGGFDFRNRIINGDMRIDQANAGNALTHSGGSNMYGPDQWLFNANGTPQFSVQQVVDAPAGFVNSLKVLVTTSGTPAATDFAYVAQYIEGLNVQDFQGGLAGAKTFTASFWVKSSITGTYSISFQNGAVDRTYITTYVISAANTWEQKTVTIPGDTSGTWAKDNGRGLVIYFDIGTGTTNQAATGSWIAGTGRRASGSIQLVANAAATWNLTGVQLEMGSAATTFEMRDYATELVRCQRYYELVGAMSTGIQASTTTVGSSGSWDLGSQFLVKKRATPIISLAPTSVLPSSISMSYLPGNGQTASALSAWTTFANTLTSWRGRITGTVGVGASVNGTAIYAVDTDGFIQADARL